jgi:hypothetical protein
MSPRAGTGVKHLMVDTIQKVECPSLSAIHCIDLYFPHIFKGVEGSDEYN